jgi:hypothetical protein
MLPKQGAVMSAADSLDAAFVLLNVIENDSGNKGQLNRLGSAIDAYVYAIGFINSFTTDYIESVDVDLKHINDLEQRTAISTRFRKLGFYWQVMDTKIDSAKNGELVVGDAIDDLLDISKEFREVGWIKTQHGTEEALAALRFRHAHHIYMHVFPLRTHIEELIRTG